MNEYEKWFEYCMICKYSYKRIDDAERVYCKKRDSRYCPYKKEIEDAEREEEE